MKLNIALELNDAQNVLAVLGELPTKTGAWPLLMMIKQQVDQQVAEAARDQGAKVGAQAADGVAT